ncbi:MAG: Sec-independent protein translocase protein TatB [Asticcacaulis sp.]|uniref:Sec-independent protein translocase protein TatB n=1 Tax=Asticcacaulis sp. TaxID=1872648 RepID=UPI0039E3BD3A
MVPGIGGGELVLIAVVALVVVGPKDLPKLLRQVGRFVGKMRRMADEFRTSFEDMARQSELEDLRKEVDALRAGQIKAFDDVSHQMKAIETDINSSLNSSTPEYKPNTYDLAATAETPAEPVNPQLEGLPPAEKETPAKPRRVRKPKAVVEASVEPEPTVTPVKRTRTKKTVA